MKPFFAKLFDIFTIIATLSFVAGVILFAVDSNNRNGSGNQSTFFISEVLWFAAIIALNYVALGKATLWNGKRHQNQDPKQ
ncbi:hypothetical protein POPA111323_05405 [Polynucleobacter paneuropaeus]|jgi:hypothetical protein|uniref:Uncharacterized protein n=2 Tax=Polynucleobacter paneuropaeus TaxID=2527775 RepID=A0A2Z4JTF8_9BURK|nr:hypothetical protein [Polynucleobacter paneuropaeus]AWW50155.1 hypothetical protein Pas1_07040 [Polynucleobacter paneuropaeus]MBT8549470.1 hypothetical protein [Polynucleobacter paneuropaeus]MBT8569261.1 hypothetical protein [Polynucleobacter paneuropaeus]MBT8609446.1 hypothetical protein [Polynucleobacter paneuropaeus]